MIVAHGLKPYHVDKRVATKPAVWKTLNKRQLKRCNKAGLILYERTIRVQYMPC